MIRIVLMVTATGLLLGGTGALFAQISPGPLSRYHASLEGLSNCTQCHDLGREVSSDKCLACHVAIGERRQQQRGYHASADMAARRCRDCHSEHNGREFEVIHWPESRERFDHAQTGFELTGAHRKAVCRDCHAEKFLVEEDLPSAESVNRERTFLGLRRSCTSCHDDEHRGQLSGDCRDCHVDESWRPASKFSHASARYPLTGKHGSVNCEKCHALEAVPLSAANRLPKRERVGFVAKYRELPFTRCTPCHQDAHDGKFGNDCQNCHTTDGFAAITRRAFDHSKTGYLLDGKHAFVSCEGCHRSEQKTDPAPHAQCRDCHRDEHGGQFADRADQGKCESCHSVATFVPSSYSMEEHQQSRLALTGSHLAVPCGRCHAESSVAGRAVRRFDFADLSCKGCHADVHKGQLDLWISQRGCEFCHNTDDWHRTSFDHKLSRFALEGKHRETPCLSCHRIREDSTGVRVVWIKPLSMECASCHEDVHRGQFAAVKDVAGLTDCRKCHLPTAWRELTFVHNRNARFALDGAHGNVACGKCHPTEIIDGKPVVRYRPLGIACSDCHGRKE